MKLSDEQILNLLILEAEIEANALSDEKILTILQSGALPDEIPAPLERVEEVIEEDILNSTTEAAARKLLH